MSIFFIRRPIFAWVLAIITMIAGGIAVATLPIAQYPQIAPPAIAISVNYPGASAETVQTTVVQIIEQQLTGLDHLLYFSSESDKDGSVQIILYFAQGTNPDIAQVQVQNKLQLAQPRLPAVVQQQGISVAKATRNFLLIAAFYDNDGRATSGDMANFIASHVQDALSRTQGVGDVQLFGTQNAMRVFLDPAKLDNYALTTADVSAAIAAQNVQVASGELGGLPAVAGQQLNATIIGPSYLSDPAQFDNILLKVTRSGAQVRVRDVGHAELAPEQYSFNARYNGNPAGAIAVKLASGANALQTVANVRQTIARLQQSFPPGVNVAYPYDTTPFVRLSIRDVLVTLGTAIFLVFVIMYVFLQNIRATLVPTIAVPVVLLGTCAILAVLGYSINSLTLFAMVLAIGLLVDDAIVVVENVERVLAEDESLTPEQASINSMRQITGALVGIALVLSAVFLPMAFISGSTGVIYRQFSVTIVSAMVLSVITALVLTPALCATLLRRTEHARAVGFFRWFNRTFDRTATQYQHGVAGLLRRPAVALSGFLLIILVMGVVFLRIPGGFLPDEDQGVMFVQVSAPPGATANRTLQVLDQVTHYLLHDESRVVQSVLAVNGFGFAGHGQSSGICFVQLKDWGDRRFSGGDVKSLVGRAMRYFATLRDAQVFAFPPPPVLELGNATGFDFELKDNANMGHAALMQARNQLLGMAASDPLLMGVRPNGMQDEPQYRLVIDREKASAYGITLADINAQLGAAWGSAYVDDFIDQGRVKRVYIQGQAASRMLPEDFGHWYVRNNATAASGGTLDNQQRMVPFSAFAHGEWISGSPKLERYNGVASVEILGIPAPGLSAGSAMAEMEKLAARLPAGFGYDWTGMSYEEQQSGSQTTLLYALSIIVVFLCLAALYESWAIPAAVILGVPLGIFGVVLATYFRGLDNDVYFQVGLLTTMGLASKNAILIVEFAKENFDAGMGLIDAAITAARQRLRPILMTSLAFILGVLPLAISTGAGSGSQNAIGTAVAGGMISATVLAIFLVPVFFVVILGLFRVQPHAAAKSETVA